ncbi:MAG: DNA-directed RNA polymerase subunit N [Candidatus Aenigmarchaeota archaeon]|nr:DNA-directed RNA polymerase subunit N [Candidatus Aenigmarchaeota archaeon]
MMIPIRCMTCGKPVGHLWEAFQKEAKAVGQKDAMDKLGLERYCCRALFVSHVDLLPRVAQFRK